MSTFESENPSPAESSASNGLDESELVVQQTIFKANHPDIAISFCRETQLPEQLPTFLDTINSSKNVLGLAATYDENGFISSIAIASTVKVLVVDLLSKSERKGIETSKENPLPRRLLQPILNDMDTFKVALQMDKIAAGLYGSCRLRIVAAKDLLSLSKGRRGSFQAVVDALGGSLSVNRRAVLQLFFGTEMPDVEAESPATIALQAWASVVAASSPSTLLRLAEMPSISTSLEKEVDSLYEIAKTVRIMHCVEQLRPQKVKNEVNTRLQHDGGRFQVESERFKTRLMPTAYHQVVKLTVVDADGTSRILTGKVPRTEGKVATLSIRGEIGSAQVESMETIGRERQGNPHRLRAMFLLSALQGLLPIKTYPMFQAIWLERKKIKWDPLPPYFKETELDDRFRGRLNNSQTLAVTKILSIDEKDRVVLVHGPPGTGKTTVIAAATITIVGGGGGSRRSVWLVAQSNVAVKNIAEKLVSEGFADFKILLSKDFHHEWHEHLYDKVEENIIRSDTFSDDLTVTEAQLAGVRVILCTLSMLSSERLDNFLQLIPVETAIFDEASQIELGEFLGPIIRSKSSLRKIVFVGDRRQLAPPSHGSAEIPTLETVFDMPRLSNLGVFLDTSYRLPEPLGVFISANVYRGRLKAVHEVTDHDCCKFVDVADGVEEFDNGYKNAKEIDAVVNIARQLFSKNLAFRIITPYDLQRSLIEKELKNVDLPWKDKCFNIDAFQGNEADYIIVSLVRTRKIGFMKDRNRTNVMLTRCRKGMIICANRRFLESKVARDTLVAIMAQKWGSTWTETLTNIV